MIKLATEEGLKVMEVMCINGAFCLTLLSLWTLKCGQLKDLVPKSKALVFFRTALAAFSGFCIFNAFSRLPLAHVYVIQFIAPSVIAITAVIFLSEKISAKKFMAVLLGFLGAYTAISPSELIWGSNETTGYMFAAGGMLGFSIAQLVLRKISGTEKPISILFAGAVAFFALGGTMSLWTINIPSPKSILFACASAPFGICGWACMLAALRRAPAATVSSLHYFQLVTGSLLGYFIWHTLPEPSIFIGGAIIIASGLAMAHLSHKEHAPEPRLDEIASRETGI